MSEGIETFLIEVNKNASFIYFNSESSGTLNVFNCEFELKHFSLISKTCFGRVKFGNEQLKNAQIPIDNNWEFS